jgi:plastocyanin
MPRILTLLLAVFALAAFGGCGDDDNGDSSSSGSAGTTAQTGAAPEPETAPGEVVMKGIMFKPKDITVKVGDTVTWKNEDPVEHNVVAKKGEDFKSDLFGEGGTYEYKVEEAGKIEYECTVHPGMTGTITVE